MSTRKVRVKKLSVKTLLPVLREDDIDPSEYESLTTETQIATGVEAAEETEYHLQSILKEAGTSNDQEIPVPPPQESQINYDQLYPSHFQQPASYIRFSQTVEECIGVSYDMTTEDDEFLKQYNATKKTIASQLSEDDFERIMEVFEETASEQAPFASIDNTIVGYDAMAPSFAQLGNPKLVNQHCPKVYEYWKGRRQANSNKPLHPSVKFETHQESDEADPYVCFRRREARQTRKTRQRDVQSAEKLKRLRKELEDGRQLIIYSYERELTKREILTADRAIFDRRARLKDIKVKLGIKGEDDDLINQKPQKKKPVEAPVLQRPPGTHLRIPVRPDGRVMEADLLLLADKLAEKENELRADVENKVQTHRKWNQNYVDLTRDPLSPVKDQSMGLNFRPAQTQYLITPPASTSSESDAMDIDEEETPVENRNMSVFHFRAGGKEKPNHQPAFRRRIGRLNRLWIDRRGMITPPRTEGEEYSDRWKYDQDDDDEPPVYDVDPYDTRALKFRATIPLATAANHRRQPLQENPANGQPHPQAVGVAGGRQALPQPPTPHGQGHVQPQSRVISQSPAKPQPQPPQSRAPAPQAPPVAKAQAASS
ncbi:Enhancer of polycomb-like protein 1 [Colletotrichum sidae]|uniref:Enhancer of polycomb-like protein n=2 Tax=Colletotrichum orbiculare species complex TaxID=2707354 RepID=A0A484FVT2_COLOR|nr:Enhancer of polycomb-like protein 1 [Colletotrichum orbiculare MAFF 240422]TEA19103.1 Enhancer of polycomb-like protein 1 [Colletotrichum sidae]